MRTCKTKTVLLGIGASVAAFKGAEVLRLLLKAGVDVWVCPTRESLNFVEQATWEALSGHPAHSEIFASTDEMPHIKLAQSADLFLVVAASADLMARLRLGRADDFLTLEALTVTAPRLIAPSMHPTMWNNPATKENVTVLKERGWTFIGPEEGPLADDTEGLGRLSSPQRITQLALEILEYPAPADSVFA